MTATILHSFYCFLSVFFLDIVWACYTHNVTAKKEIKAGFYAALIMICTNISTIFVIGNYYNIIPAMLGAFLGTVVTVRRIRNS